MSWVRWVAASAVLGSMVVATPASADKPDKDGKRELREERKETREKLRDSREERRKARHAELRAKYGDLADRPAFREELRVHARRMARLHRLERIAKAKGNEEGGKRVEALIAKETARHDKRVQEMKEEAKK